MRNPRPTTAACVRGRWSTWIEGSVLVAEVILLAFFSIPFWTRNVDAAPPPEHEATVLRVIAEQFAWHVHSPGADGVFGRTDLTLVNPDNPLGLDRTEAVGRDDLVVNGRLFRNSSVERCPTHPYS